MGEFEKNQLTIKTDRAVNEMRELRYNMRELLYKAGIGSNPGWSNVEIINEVRQKAGLPPAEASDELEQYSSQKFRTTVVSTLREAGVELKEPVTEIGISYGLSQLFSKQNTPK